MLITKIKDVFASNRKGTDKQDTRQPDKDCYKNRHIGEQLLTAQNLVAKGVVEQC